MQGDWFMKIIRYLMKKYYLSNVCKGRITKEEVADIYSTSVENVEKAVHEFEETKNPFRKADSRSRKENIQILISLVSIGLVLLTLYEMQAERNAAYMPDISINCSGSGIKFAWDEDHNIDRISDTEKKLLNMLADSTFYEAFDSVKLTVQNIGVGVAKDIYIDWLYNENIPLYQKVFSENTNISIIRDNLGVGFEPSETLITSGILPIMDYPIHMYDFLTSDLHEKQELEMPQVFTVMYEVAYAYGIRDDFPDCRFNVFYKDVQGESYKKTFVIHFQPYFAHYDPNNNGSGAFTINILEQNTEHTSVFRKYGYIFVYCGIGCILVFSVLLISAILFEKKRRRIIDASKNRKSVKPKLANKDELYGEEGRNKKTCK